ncbi:MAG TPA: hypothetical protein VMV13_04475 [Candidatus Binataceae bacterium]|nr:hypothetical protein [Candidatus Binataceae bacterium]
MTLGWAVPTIAAIQRTNVLLVALTAAALAYLVSINSAIGCMLGGAVVIANLWILAALGRLVLAAAGAGISGNAARLGAAAIPLKLLIVVGLVYLAFTRAHIDGLGFGFGVLTQLAAIIIETGRASLAGAA